MLRVSSQDVVCQYTGKPLTSFCVLHLSFCVGCFGWFMPSVSFCACCSSVSASPCLAKAGDTAPLVKIMWHRESCHISECPRHTRTRSARPRYVCTAYIHTYIFVCVCVYISAPLLSFFRRLDLCGSATRSTFRCSPSSTFRGSCLGLPKSTGA